MAWKDDQGRWLTVGLFKETASQAKWVVYKLEEAKALYLQCGDPTGYKFAVEHLGGWQHWKAIKSSPSLEAIIALWEEELEVKLRCDGLAQVINHARTDKGYQAAKYLTEAGWAKQKVGRPSGKAVDKAARLQNKMYDEFSNVVELGKK